MIIGRTDVPWATGDIQDMVRRANAYTEAGADLVLLTGVHPRKLAEVRSRISGKVVAGLRPGVSAGDFETAGANLLIWYPVCLLAAYQGGKTALARMQETSAVDDFADILGDQKEFEKYLGYGDYVSKVNLYGS